MTAPSTPADPGVEGTVARPGGVSYLRIPARDVAQSAEFYRAVFGWRLRGTPQAPSFSDGTGHVIGHWRSDLPAAGEARHPALHLRHRPRRHPAHGSRTRRRTHHPALPGRKPEDSDHPRSRRQRHRHLAGATLTTSRPGPCMAGAVPPLPAAALRLRLPCRRSGAGGDHWCCGCARRCSGGSCCPARGGWQSRFR